jgi:hypothetical protein
MNWRKSSYSGGNGGDCVEVANDLGALRDSKGSAVLLVPVAGLVRAVSSGFATKQGPTRLGR